MPEEDDADVAPAIVFCKPAMGWLLDGHPPRLDREHDDEILLSG